MRILENDQTKKLYFTIGISGCGKSTYTKKLAADTNAVVVNPDSIRKAMTGDVSDQTKNNEVFQQAYADVDTALASGKNVVFDSTGLYPPLRAAMIEKAKANNVEAVAIVFADSHNIDKCRARVKQALDNGEDRANTVIDSGILERQYKGFQKAVHDMKAEDWTSVITI